MKARRNRFTLIELLVVVASLAILLSILLPALSKARDSSYKIMCANNMRQTYSILLGYAGDWGEWLPNAVGRSGDYGGIVHGYWCSIVKDSFSGSDSSFWKTLRCPYAPKVGLGPSNLASSASSYAYGFRYYLSSSYPDAFFHIGKAMSAKGLRLWTSASSYPVLSDSIKIEGGVTPMQYSALDGARVHIRHSGGAELLFMDGHVEHKSAAQIVVESYGPSFGITIDGNP